MTQFDKFVGTSLPHFFRCLGIPVQWQSGRIPGQAVVLQQLLHGDEPGFIHVTPLQSISRAYAFDPREKRTEFFRLERGNTEALLAFLDKVGLFQRVFREGAAHPYSVAGRESDLAVIRLPDGRLHELTYLKEVKESELWDWRDWLMDSMQHKKDVETAAFEVRIERVNNQPRVIFTTLTFKDAVLLATKFDQVVKAAVRKCARPDCGAVFTFTTAHKRKYCRWECGHLVSVRRARRRARRS